MGGGADLVSQGRRKLTPDVWGESFWVAIHAVALGYPGEAPPETDRAAYRAFFQSLAGVLPCSLCRDEYAELLRRRPLEPALAAGREALFRWTVDVHNEVGRRTGKADMTYRYVRDVYVFREDRTRAAPRHEDSPDASGAARAPDPALHWIGAMLAVLLVVGVVWVATRGRGDSTA